MFIYKIPNDILSRIPEHFWAALAGELVSIFSPSVFEKDKDGTRALNYVSGTSGWNAALKMTCRRLNMVWLYDYYDELAWYDSDKFDGEIEELLESRFLEAGDSTNCYYRWVISL